MTMELDQHTSPIESVDNDVLTLITLFCDAESAISLQKTKNSLINPQMSHVWKNIFRRLGFSTEDINEDYLVELQKRIRLSQKLTVRTTPSSCFRLPNRNFFFHPILPLDQGAHFDWTDPPPVEFDCDSFLFTSTATSPEIVMLDPFSGALCVYENVLDNAVRSDEGVMEEAMRQTTQKIITDNMHDSGHYIMQDAIEDLLYKNTRIHDCVTEPKQVLLETVEYFDIDLNDYLLRTNQNELQEFEIGYVGIESKSFIEDGQATGTMIAVGRTLTSDQSTERVVELVAWTRPNKQLEYGWKQVCRFNGTFNAVDICANQGLLYVNPVSATTPTYGSNKIHAYPFESYTPRDPGHTGRRYFPEPKFTLTCPDPITAIAVCAGGSQVVSTTSNNVIHIWNISKDLTRPVASIDVAKKLQKAFEARESQPSFSRTSHTGIFLPRTQSIEKGGFITLQYSRNDGLRLLYFRKTKEEWDIESIISLPLSGRRIPRIHFDGRRIVVFGQDHIGSIILIYKLRFSNDEAGTFADVKTNEEIDGGVYNLRSPASTIFANRIRHAALGGIESFDGMYMTCNERFIAVNTKTGNLLSGSSGGYTDGLLVVDIDDA